MRFFPALKLLLTNGGFCFSYLFDARKVGVAVRDKLLFPRKRFLQSRGPACPRAKKPCECCEVATWSHFGFFFSCFCFPPWSNPLWMSKTLRFSLLGDCWEGRFFALDTWDFWGGFGFGFCLGIGGWYTGCILCLFTSEHCAECAFFGARMVSCFWESASCHILGNGKWFHGSVGFRLGFPISFSTEKSIAIACLPEHLHLFSARHVPSCCSFFIFASSLRTSRSRPHTCSSKTRMRLRAAAQSRYVAADRFLSVELYIVVYSCERTKISCRIILHVNHLPRVYRSPMH